ncbi:MAG: YceD family protein [Acidobacteriota bacterium]
MKIRLDQIDDSFDWQETVTLSAADLDRPEVVDLGAIRCRGKIHSVSEEDLLMQAKLSYEQTLCCMRCLGPVVDSVSAELSLLVGSNDGRDEAPAEGERELQESELSMLVVENEVLDTEPMIIEQVQLAVPMKPLCREDCAGLCSTCGVDLNRGSCECEAAVDPRWGALAGLKLSPSKEPKKH